MDPGSIFYESYFFNGIMEMNTNSKILSRVLVFGKCRYFSNKPIQENINSIKQEGGLSSMQMKEEAAEVLCFLVRMCLPLQRTGCVCVGGRGGRSNLPKIVLRMLTMTFVFFNLSCQTAVRADQSWRPLVVDRFYCDNRGLRVFRHTESIFV